MSNLKYISEKFDSCLNTYRETFTDQSKISSDTSGSSVQQYDSAVILPLDFSLEMDGISGIIPNSAFEVPPEVLPKSYLTRKKESKIGFILHTIDHNFNNNKWTTKITGQTINLRFDELSAEEKARRELFQLQNTISNNNTNNDNNLPGVVPDDYPPNISKNIVETIPALTRLKNLIGFHESNNNYGIANTGGNAKRSVINVNGLTFDTLKKQQQIPNESNPQRVFAAGRFQIIPSTMEIIKSRLKLKGTDRYDPKNQERMGDWLLLENRPGLGNYIKGKNAGTAGELTSAIDSIGYEWASMPVVIRSGSKTKVGDVVKGTGQAGNYGGSGANPTKSKVSVKLMANTIINARIAYCNKKPSFVPTYYTPFV
jgi:muramidase (phage lysozyme)